MDFQAFSYVNRMRCNRWHPRGLHSWSLSVWYTAASGELGEGGNVIKKMNRVRDGLTGNRGLSQAQLQGMLADELADTVIYIDLLAQAAGISLENAVRDKFNRVSLENGFPETL
jgi:NTP pyrophosphatase (non-canonical NTP hydrolase)